jgi:hypothetical protein
VRELGVEPDQEVVVVEEVDGLLGRNAWWQSGDMMEGRYSIESLSPSAYA